MTSNPLNKNLFSGMILEQSIFMVCSSEDDSSSHQSNKEEVMLKPRCLGYSSGLMESARSSSCPLKSNLTKIDLKRKCQSFKPKQYENFVSQVMLNGLDKNAEDLSFSKKSFYQNLLEAELFHYYQTSGSIKECVLSIINTKDGSKFLQGLLKDLPKDCFKLIFFEVNKLLNYLIIN